ncbi:hypothetical protein MAR_000525, partial [Mya arenaria]
SLFSQVDLIRTELVDFDIFAFCETWLTHSSIRATYSFCFITLPNSKIVSLTTMAENVSYIYTRRQDLEVLGIECIWIKLALKSNLKMLVGLFYRPPNTTAPQDLRI